MDKTKYFLILKQLHDICRNNPLPKLTGMDAYSEIINYLYLCYLSDWNDELEEKYTLRYLYENYCTDEDVHKDSIMYEKKITNRSGATFRVKFLELGKLLLPTLNNTENHNSNIAFSKIMEGKIDLLKSDTRITNILFNTDNNNHGRKAQLLINKIYSDDFLPRDDQGRFDMSNFPYDAIGEGFEKFMNDAGSSGGNWGQYFTNIQVIDWVIEQVKIKKTDKVIDPFAGSGGFILRAKQKCNLDGKKVYGREYDYKIIKYLHFNALMAGIRKKNIVHGDSFDYNKYLEDSENKFDCIISNPPFGESVDILLNEFDSKIKYWKCLKSGNYTIKNSSGLALYSIIKTLNNGGRGGIVVDRGLLNNGSSKNSWQRRLRKYLLENCNVTDILLLPTGIFSYTNFDTCCLIFTKGTATKNIQFHEGYFDKKDKGKSNKKMHINDDFLNISFEQIVNNDWSLNYEDYIEKKEEELIDGIEYKTIDELFNILPKSKRLAKYGKETGKYPFFTSSLVVNKFTDTNDYNKESLIIGGGGKPNINYSKKFSCSGDCFVLQLKENININVKFTYYYLLLNLQMFGELYKGNGLKHIAKKSIEKIKIPLLPTEQQEEIIEFLNNNFTIDNIIGIINKFTDIDLFLFCYNNKFDNIKELQTLYLLLQDLNNSNSYTQTKNLIHNINLIDTDTEDDFEYVEIKGKTYIKENNNIYKIGSDGETKGKLYGTLDDNNKLHKIKKNKKIESMDI